MMNSILSPNPATAKDYNRIAQAICFMQQHCQQQPDLGIIAHHIHLSPYHFQRLFTKWAGISPKRFLQYLTVESAKSQMLSNKSLLDLSLELGLSGAGRLHDLFVNLEALSPGEFKTQGANLSINYGIHPTPFGFVLIAVTPRGICHLSFPDEEYLQNPEKLLRLTFMNAEMIPDSLKTQPLIEQIFNPDIFSNPKPLTVLVKGTNFQIQVWRALLEIPLGQTTTYQQIAQGIHRPTATRAVGNAVGQNPIAYLIPCHRVIKSSGQLGGYRWGSERKEILLNWELTHHLSNP
jgi:AraC family transcriptional regulator of adaptative response/methylated-DNA-[protein]-cysteine methyltransferase